MSINCKVINVGDHEISGYPSFVQLLRYWTALHDSGHLPGKDDFGRFDHLLPFMMFFEVVDGGVDFQTRLCLTAFLQLFDLLLGHA